MRGRRSKASAHARATQVLDYGKLRDETFSGRTYALYANVCPTDENGLPESEFPFDGWADLCFETRRAAIDYARSLPAHVADDILNACGEGRDGLVRLSVDEDRWSHGEIEESPVVWSLTLPGGGDA